MPNMQIPLVGLTAEQIVACVIFCCDKQPYDFDSKQDPEKSCQRMGSRKHSCVLHNLRERTDSGKLTQKNRHHDMVRANPPVQAIGGSNCIPDCLVNDGTGWQVVDAKFPCEPKDLNKKLGVPPKKKAGGAKGVVYESPVKSGAEMMTAKERDLYPKFKVDGAKTTKKPICMTPSDAEAKRGECDCTKVDSAGG